MTTEPGVYVLRNERLPDREAPFCEPRKPTHPRSIRETRRGWKR